jgi:hypothetical protein
LTVDRNRPDFGVRNPERLDGVFDGLVRGDGADDGMPAQRFWQETGQLGMEDKFRQGLLVKAD